LKNPVLVNNSLVKAQVTGEVKASGTPDRLLLDGTLTPQPGGLAYFRYTPFEITSGFVEYDKMPPDNPKIYMTANAHVTESVQDEQQRSTEHQYDVNLLVQGRAKPPQITLTSQPPLSQREIVSLLALGVTGTGMDASTSEEQASSTSSAVGAALLQNAGGRRLKDSLGVDLKVSSSQPTPENASKPKVTLSKQWTPKFGASASSTLQANPSNEVKLEYKMNKNISVIGSWDGKETNAESTGEPAQSVFGLDLEYKVQFK
jgi:translocation and assembly module TamB